MKKLLALLLMFCLILPLGPCTFAIGNTVPSGFGNQGGYVSLMTLDSSYVSPLTFGKAGIENMDVSSVYGLWENVCGLVDMFLPVNMIERPEYEQDNNYLYLENKDDTVEMALYYIASYERGNSEIDEEFSEIINDAVCDNILFDVFINGIEWNGIITDWESYLYRYTDTGDICIFVIWNYGMNTAEYRALRDNIFCSVVPVGEDWQYEKIQAACAEKISEKSAEIIAHADSMIQLNDYCGAVEAFESGAELLGVSYFESSMAKLINIWQNSVVLWAMELAAKGNFKTVLNYDMPDEYYQLLDWIEQGHIQPYIDEAYINLNDDIEQMWTSSVLKEAEEAYKENGDYTAAIRSLQQSGLVNTDIEEAIAFYQALAPISLTSLDYVQKAKYISVGSDGHRISSGSLKDVNENSYDQNSVICPLYDGFGLNGDKPDSDNEAYVTYYLGAKYSRLSGLIYRTFDSLRAKAESWNDKKISIKIYGDDVLLYEAPVITVNIYDNIPFDIDVTGVRNLKIVMQGRFQFSTSDLGIYEYVPIVAMTDTILSY